jgi:hypothetical protein
MKPAVEQSTAILQTKGFKRNSAKTMGNCPEIENISFEARTI